MSRIGNRILEKPQDVVISLLDNSQVSVKGPKGELSCKISPSITVKVEDTKISLTKSAQDIQTKAYHGLYNALINNMIQGVTTGYKKTLELIGVGYKANTQGNVLELNLGFSHNIFFEIPEEVKITAEMAKGKNPLVHIEGIDKQLVGQIAAKIRSLRKPEPYKGKGVRYQGEEVRRKAGKTAAK